MPVRCAKKSTTEYTMLVGIDSIYRLVRVIGQAESFLCLAMLAMLPRVSPSRLPLSVKLKPCFLPLQGAPCIPARHHRQRDILHAHGHGLFHAAFSPPLRPMLFFSHFSHFALHGDACSKTVQSRFFSSTSKRHAEGRASVNGSSKPLACKHPPTTDTPTLGHVLPQVRKVAQQFSRNKKRISSLQERSDATFVTHVRYTSPDCPAAGSV
ncbi:hypothetical protein V8C35DRAFT_288799 [Trichoderma chlorosporum]